MTQTRFQHWTISWSGQSGSARREGVTLSSPSPAGLWAKLAEEPAHGPFYLAGVKQDAIPEALERAASTLVEQKLGALIGRIEYADGSLSWPMTRMESCRFLSTDAGALLVTKGALAKAAESIGERSWDRFWPSDLVGALAADGSVRGSFDGFARCSSATRPAWPERLPFARATPLTGHTGSQPLILVYGDLAASVSLYFDGLPPDLRSRLRFLKPGDLSSDLGWLASAGLVVVMRDFRQLQMSGVFDLLREIGVPYVWFTDDDLITLKAEEGRPDYFSPEALKTFLTGASAVLVTSDALAHRLAPLHPTLIRWPCIYDPSLRLTSPVAGHTRFKVGAIGGAFRRRSFEQHVLPALKDVGLVRPIEIIATSELARTRHDTPVTARPFEPEFRPFVFDWQKIGLDVLVHPYGETKNIANKSMASLLVSAYLGAVPIVGHETAFDEVTEAQGVLKAGRSPSEWKTQLEHLADPVLAQAMFGTFDAWCRDCFDPEKARAPFLQLEALALPCSYDEMAVRWQAASQTAATRKLAAQLLTHHRRGLFDRLSRSIKKRQRTITKFIAGR